MVLNLLALALLKYNQRQLLLALIDNSLEIAFD
jgi:hypothetical protein